MFEIMIPEGRKPGKVLAKTLGYEPPWLSDLVQGLSYEVSAPKYIERALHDCHSCQSDNVDEYAYVWLKTPGEVIFLQMTSPEGDIVARCLINEDRRTMAPCYGPKHYLLSARLKYFGYALGQILPIDVLEERLAEYHRPTDPVIPRSVKERTTIILEDPSDTIVDIFKEIEGLDWGNTKT